VDPRPETESGARVVDRLQPYDEIGHGYAEVRRPDPRIQARIMHALGAASSILNVGSGPGSYEPVDRRVIALEPSGVMLAQRPRGAAAAVQAVAERLPFPDAAFDRRAGYAELCRVSPLRVVLTFDPQVHNQHWFLREYVPSVALFDEQHAPTIDEIADGINASYVETVPIPYDCTDGFTAAYWRRPHAYLDPEVRRGHSGIAQADPTVVERGLERLREDLETGRWYEAHPDILELAELDVGIRIVVGSSDHAG
jgi:hypothetical protein